MTGPPDREFPAWLGRLAVVLLLLAAFTPRARYIAEPNVGDARASAAVEAAGWPAKLGVEPQDARDLLQCAALAAQLLAALALTGLLRDTHGLAAGLFSLALWGSLPIAVLHGALWGPENAGLACGLLAGLGAQRWIRGGSALAALGAGVAALVGLRVGPSAACFALALALPYAGVRRGRVTIAAGVLLLAGSWALHHAEPGPDLLPPFGRDPLHALGLAASTLAGAGVLLRCARLVSPRARARLDRQAVGAPPRVDLVLPLLAAGLASLALEPHPSLVLLTPAVAAAGAASFVQVSRPLLALRAGLGPVVIAVGMIVVPGLAGFEHMRQEYRAAEVRP